LPAPVDGAETHSKAGNSAAYLPREMPSATFYCISYLTRCPAFFPLFFVFRLSLRAGWAAPVVSPRLIRTFWWFFEERFSAFTMPASCGNRGRSQAARISRKVLAVAAAMLVLVGGQSANAVKIGISSNDTSSDLATPDVRARDVLTPQMSVNTSSVPATCLETCTPIFETEKTCATNLTCLCTDPAAHSFALCIDCVVGTAPSTLAQSAGQGVISDLVARCAQDQRPVASQSLSLSVSLEPSGTGRPAATGSVSGSGRRLEGRWVSGVVLVSVLTGVVATCW
ncbi:unnamed protein product, partial [Mycena citricolor]